MATSEVAKYAVFDPRIVQTKPKYAIERGAQSISNVSFNAQTANSTSQQFNVVVPSENVFIDRAVDWSSGGVVSIPLTLSGAPADGDVLLTPAVDVSLACFPSHQCVSQMTATINDATTTVNTADILNYVLRLQDVAKHRKQRTTPTMLDLYAVEKNASVFQNSPLGGFEYRFEGDASPNGAFTQWWFCNADGTVAAGTNVNANGLPIAVAASGANQVAYLRWQSSEKLFLPPFIFGDDYELSTGLFGVQNFQVQMNMLPTPSRAVRLADSVVGRTVGARTISAVGVPQWVTTGLSASTYAPYPVQPSLAVLFMTPALDVPLPPKSICPYFEFPRYITTSVNFPIVSTLKLAPNNKGITMGGMSVSSNTISLPNIPDLLMIYAKPSVADVALTTSGALYTGGPPAATWSSQIGDFTLPIEGISLNFDNFSGLLANHTQAQLYKMSVQNGLEMDFASWRGIGKTVVSTQQPSSLSSLVGGPLVLRPGRDFALQTGQSAGLVGNFTLQVDVKLGNQFPVDIAKGINLYVVPISSGFFETIKGSSRIIKGVLSEQDILSAAPSAPSADLQRKVGSAKPASSSMSAYA